MDLTLSCLVDTEKQFSKYFLDLSFMFNLKLRLVISLEKNTYIDYNSVALSSFSLTPCVSGYFLYGYFFYV